jgi:hypothetical protein
MIKRFFFTAVLLAPGLAYAGNPSADLSGFKRIDPCRCSLRRSPAYEEACDA